MQMGIAGWRDDCAGNMRKEREAEERRFWQDGVKSGKDVNLGQFKTSSRSQKLRGPGISLIEKVWGRGKGRDGEVSILRFVIVF